MRGRIPGRRDSPRPGSWLQGCALFAQRASRPMLFPRAAQQPCAEARGQGRGRLRPPSPPRSSDRQQPGGCGSGSWGRCPGLDQAIPREDGTGPQPLGRGGAGAAQFIPHTSLPAPDHWPEWVRSGACLLSRQSPDPTGLRALWGFTGARLSGAPTWQPRGDAACGGPSARLGKRPSLAQEVGKRGWVGTAGLGEPPALAVVGTARGISGQPAGPSRSRACGSWTDPLGITGQVRGFGHRSEVKGKSQKGSKLMCLPKRTSGGLRQAEDRVCWEATGCAPQGQAGWGGLPWLFSRGFSGLCCMLPWLPSPPACPLLWAQSPSNPEALQSPSPYS